MGKKFIPNGDEKFSEMAHGFALAIAKEPAKFAVAREDADRLLAVVETYRQALYAARQGGTRSQETTRLKDVARAEAEKQIRRIALLIRASDRVDASLKALLNLGERPARVKSRGCPQEPPSLRFVRALHEARGGTPRHELRFEALHAVSNAKPEGAVRLELFVDLVPVDEAIPAWPGANHGGRPWYLRSYTRSPIVLAPPMTKAAMRVVYWGRWADSTGGVGPFSSTAVGWIEGGSRDWLPGSATAAGRSAKLLEDGVAAGRDESVSVTVLEARVRELQAQEGPGGQRLLDAA